MRKRGDRRRLKRQEISEMRRSEERVIEMSK